MVLFTYAMCSVFQTFGTVPAFNKKIAYTVKRGLTVRAQTANFVLVFGAAKGKTGGTMAFDNEDLTYTLMARLTTSTYNGVFKMF
jgi:hypothetical protein